MKFKTKRVNALQWVFEPLQDQPGFFQKKMFGCEAAYFQGLLVLVIADTEEPWNGLLVCTSREHHPFLIKLFPALRPHSILGKWLYVSQTSPEFEDTAAAVIQKVLARDLRIGVESKPKKRKPKLR